MSGAMPRLIIQLKAKQKEILLANNEKEERRLMEQAKIIALRIQEEKKKL